MIRMSDRFNTRREKEHAKERELNAEDIEVMQDRELMQMIVMSDIVRASSTLRMADDRLIFNDWLRLNIVAWL